MDSRAKAAGHPIHQQLIVFPLGLTSTAVLFDVLQRLTGNEDLTVASYYMLAAGVLFGMVAGVFGFIDYLAVPDGTRAKQVGRLHGIGNEVVLVLFAVSWFLRPDGPDYVPGTLAFLLGLAGAGLSVVTGWLGGELVSRLGVGVHDDAHLNAPRDLSTGIRLR